MRYVCCGNFAEAIRSLIAEKRNCGYSYKTTENVLKRFDRFSVEKFPNKKILDKEIIMTWACKKENEGNGNFQNRIGAVRELARFISRNGGKAFVVPKGIGRKPLRKVPHIFSEEELKEIFKQADTLSTPNHRSIRHLIAPVLFRMLYSCGLRPSEALKLKVQHVDLETGVIFIEESKGHKDRNVVCSYELQQLLIKFNILASDFVADRAYFFPKEDGNCYSSAWLIKLFEEIWRNGDLKENKKPRLYDFRHTFATKCMLKWISENKKLDSMLPYLSAYMGHENYSDTAYYIHLTLAYDMWSISKYSSKFNDMIPEVQV